MKQKKYLLVSLLTAFSIILTACSSSNGTYVYEGNIAFKTKAKAELTIDGDNAKLKIEGVNFLDDKKTTEEYNVMVDHKNGTMIIGNETVKFDIKDKQLRITDGQTGIYKGKVFTKK